ncbi:helix-turn-helix transcriptional regulator [Glutamicibacter sp. PS]|uniref:helix-turn-helix domain-containing protein n=1 Tax=Glutamicibacter sp. PS TaxID=3075634 RepID=UPI00283CB8FB|nr:helix-turn-helix transcriptional regulator [Glutamicibacter sp. PS]MDR4534747.1 helix-turn-helix domain-containing protein [Glutamicibacter sp. PS]
MVRLPLSAIEIRRGEILGALLRAARGPRTILQVALEAGISPETLRKIETGRVATPSFATIASVATVVDLSLDEIWIQLNRAAAPDEDLKDRTERIIA